MMKRILLLLAAMSVCAFASAQNQNESFDDFVRRIHGDFDGFRKEIEKNFSDYLRQSWEEFEVFAGEVKQRKPKPEVLPVAPKDTVSSSVRLSGAVEVAEEVGVTGQNPEPEAGYKVKMEEPQENMSECTFDFYNVDASMSLPGEILACRLNGISESAVADFWDKLEKSRYNAILHQIDVYADRIGLEGWSRYMWVDSLVKSAYGAGLENEREVLRVFLLTQMGIDVRMGVADGSLVTLMAISQKVYSRRFVVIDGVRYYIDRNHSDATSLRTYKRGYSEKAVAPLNVAITKPIALFNPDDGDHVKMVRHHSDVLESDLILPVNKNRCVFYEDYPQVDANIYAMAAQDPVFVGALTESFAKVMHGKTELEKVSVLMNFMHFDFKYATDQDQFGYEKPFFLEEDFVFPYNDCEDRSILFSYLVKNLTGLDVIILDYPDHISTAVAFTENISGDYVQYNDKKYVICDPTYEGAPVGLTMKGYAKQEFRILPL